MDDPSGSHGDAYDPQPRARRVAGREIVFDQEGFFQDPDDWSPEAAQELARESGLDELREVHWRVLRFLREFYQYNGRAPLNRQLKQGAGLSLLDLEGLFPGGLKQGARRLAGLPNPKSCA
ncbi:MAG: TusE/DsrC/DsvC family sulfur relay protein [Desulfarculus sp.]|nr:MAG: TusE/DsrC/DsvC family sulfur relay protein [Desulfarculus sp.]